MHESSFQILHYSIWTHRLADTRTAKVHDRTDLLFTRTEKVDRSVAILSARASSQTRIVSALHKQTPPLLPEPISRSECRCRRPHRAEECARSDQDEFPNSGHSPSPDGATPGRRRSAERGRIQPHLRRKTKVPRLFPITTSGFLSPLMSLAIT